MEHTKQRIAALVASMALGVLVTLLATARIPKEVESWGRLAIAVSIVCAFIHASGSRVIRSLKQAVEATYERAYNDGLSAQPPRQGTRVSRLP